MDFARQNYLQSKNKEKTRAPEMKSSKKGNNYYFGMKTHIGVDGESGFVHSMETTSANVHDIVMTAKLFHGEEAFIYGDAGYITVQKREEFSDKQGLSFQINKRSSSVKKLPDCQNTEEIRFHEKEKSRIRSKVERPFHIIKNLFKFKKTNYLGLIKNTAKLYTLFALANLYLCQMKGLSLQAQK